MSITSRAATKEYLQNWDLTFKAHQNEGLPKPKYCECQDCIENQAWVDAIAGKKAKPFAPECPHIEREVLLVRRNNGETVYGCKGCGKSLV